MADYHPLIAKAVAALDPNAPGESRRALYERARTALIAQLRSVQPPLSESEITRERLALEEAVRKVEAEAAQRARDARQGSSQGGSSQGGSPQGSQGSPRPGAGDALHQGAPRSSAGDAIRQAGARPPQGAPSATSRPSASQRPASPPPPRPQQAPPPRPQQAPPPRSQQAPPRPQQAPHAPPPESSLGARDHSASKRVPEPSSQPPQAPNVRGYRDVAAPDNLGRSPAPANRTARRTYANVPPPSESDQPGPRQERRGRGSTDESMEEAERNAPVEPAQHHLSVLAETEELERDNKARKRSRFPLLIVIGIACILVGIGIVWHERAAEIVSGLWKSSPAQVVETPKDPLVPGKGKIRDRLGDPPSSFNQVAPVAQRAGLYEQGSSDQPTVTVGTVVWRIVPANGSDNQASDITVRADVEIPDRKFKMTMSFQRNTDPKLPASHTVDLNFDFPPDFQGGGISSLVGIMMKSSETVRGMALDGGAIKVNDRYFLAALSNTDKGLSRNLQLLKERPWFDIAIVFADQHQAVITIEKGAPGQRAFEEAFTEWGQ